MLRGRTTQSEAGAMARAARSPTAPVWSVLWPHSTSLVHTVAPQDNLVLTVAPQHQLPNPGTPGAVSPSPRQHQGWPHRNQDNEPHPAGEQQRKSPFGNRRPLCLKRTRGAAPPQSARQSGPGCGTEHSGQEEILMQVNAKYRNCRLCSQGKRHP